MNTLLSRTNAIFAFTLSILALLTFLCSISTAFKDYASIVDVKINSQKKLVKYLPDYNAGRERNDLGVLTFDLDGDFTRCFDWNTKQLFIYLTAHYSTKNNPVNQVVLWDHIIERGQETRLKLRDHHTKYYFWDDGNGLKGNENVTLTLSLNVIPNAGVLPIATSQVIHSFAFPRDYSTKSV